MPKTLNFKLTESELEQIAKAIKSHTRNLYGKLGVRSRREAVTQARVLGFLR